MPAFPVDICSYGTQTAAFSPQLSCHALTTCDPQLANSYHELLEYVPLLWTEGVLESSQRTILRVSDTTESSRRKNYGLLGTMHWAAS